MTNPSKRPNGSSRVMIVSSDYPRMEGTWPDTMEHLRTTFAGSPEDEARAMLGGTALELYDFDADVVKAAAEKIGPELADIVGGN